MNTTTPTTSKADYDNIELQIKKDAGEIRKDLNQNFLMEHNDIVKNAMMIPKDKKEQGVTEEQIKLNILKLFQKQKRFQGSENVLKSIQYLALYHKENEDIGKIVNIDMINKTFEYFTYSSRQNQEKLKVAKWSEVLTFDYNSIQMDVIYDKYKRGNEANMSFIETYAFLDDADFRTKSKMKEDFNYTKGFGTLLNDPLDHPVLQQVVKERNVTKEDVSRPKRKLQKMDKNTLELLEEYNSVREATE